MQILPAADLPADVLVVQMFQHFARLVALCWHSDRQLHTVSSMLQGVCEQLHLNIRALRQPSSLLHGLQSMLAQAHLKAILPDAVGLEVEHGVQHLHHSLSLRRLRPGASGRVRVCRHVQSCLPSRTAA